MNNYKTIIAPYISKKKIQEVVNSLKDKFTPCCSSGWDYYQPSVIYKDTNYDDLLVTTYRNFIKMKYEQNKKVFAKKFVFDRVQPKH